MKPVQVTSALWDSRSIPMDLESLRFLYLRRVIGTALQAVGVEAADRFARMVGRGVYSLHGLGRVTAEARVRGWLGSTANEEAANGIIRSMYEHTARFWIESLYLSRLLRASSWRGFVQVHEAKRWETIANSPRGCLIATAYFGNPGVLAWALGQIFRPLYVIADRFGEGSIGAWQRDLYRADWVEPLDRRYAAAQLPMLLERGEAVMIVAEAERESGRACETAFLGRRVRAYPTLARLAHAFDAPIVAAVCSRKCVAFRFDIEMGGAVEYGEDDDGVMGEVLARIERMIAKRPEQYLWSTPTLGGRRGQASNETSLIPDSALEAATIGA